MSKKIVFTSMVGILLTVCLMVSCGDLDVKLPGAAKASALPNAIGNRPLTANAASNLLEDVLSNSGFQSAVKNADVTVFEDKLGKPWASGDGSYYNSVKESKSFSQSVSINEKDKFKNGLINAFNYGTPGYVSPISVGEASIKGSNKWSFDSNRNLSWWFTEGFYKDDNMKSSSSSKRDIKITDYKYISGSTTYTVSAIISVTEELKADLTYDNSAYTGWLDGLGTSSSSKSISIALSISDGTWGAKYRLSFSDANSSKTRSSQSGNNEIESDVEVYDNSNTLIYTLRFEGNNYNIHKLSFLRNFK